MRNDKIDDKLKLKEIGKELIIKRGRIFFFVEEMKEEIKKISENEKIRQLIVLHLIKETAIEFTNNLAEAIGILEAVKTEMIREKELDAVLMVIPELEDIE